ncbi:Dienelactone hydrolase family protein [Candidatus Terasakiella magnetica]|uniref:Dienelactone hydrolase family protein n=1 Tax=Candidatus Terasakiella magnetica TaxID=1867952 RepID=A0A1C3RHS9_9PROT|nr:dienelactone hydrolase family protein [Candidatus Terasakiella magnetica]SCA56827.1 Dienelactone hydrolase family protein [Candidatus Terasakiella magnetica]
MSGFGKVLILAVAINCALWSFAQAKVVGEEIKYSVDGQEFTGYLTYDDAMEGPRPGVLVVHEWWGHNPYARKRAEMLATLGYTALALDMYGTGKLANHPKDAKAFMMATISNIAVAEKRFDAAHDLLKSQSMVNEKQTAAIGYCFGGGMVLHAARTGRDLKGVISYHGSLKTQTPAMMGAVKAKVRVYNGAADPFIKPEHISAFKAEMQAAGVDYNFVNYEGALHSFTNPDADAFAKKFKMPVGYDAMADGDSWMRTRAFLSDIFQR